MFLCVSVSQTQSHTTAKVTQDTTTASTSRNNNNYGCGDADDTAAQIVVLYTTALLVQCQVQLPATVSIFS